MKKLLLFSLAVVFGLMHAYAQQKVSGTVTEDGSDFPLPGVNVLIKGTSTGTVTGTDGAYSLEVSGPDAVLVFTFIGYEAQEITVGSQSVINVALSPDLRELEEVVVIGYGTQKKSDVTGAIASVTGEDIRNSVTASMDQALQGRVAGVQVTQNSGQPGGAVSVRIRGTTSITGSSEPLYVIDGIQIGGGATGITGFDWQGGAGGQQGAISNPLASINPNDIEKIEVLKDASATAIYGSRAANGVIIVTTKRGSKGAPTISYNGFFALQDVYKTFDLMDLQTYAQYNNEVADEVSTIAPNERFADPSILGRGTDWQEAIYQVAPMQSHTVSATGGTEATQYMVSLGYFDQEGIVIGSDFNRFTLRANIDSEIKKGLKFGLSLSLSRKDETIGLQDGGDGVISQAAQMPPSIPVTNFDGSYAGPEGQSGSAQIGSNPVGLALLRNNTVLDNRLLSNLFADIQIMDGLSFRTELGVDYGSRTNKAFIPTYQWGTLENLTSQLGQSNNSNIFWLWKNYFTYIKNIENHSITVTAGYESQKAEWDNFTAYKINLPNDIPVINQGDVSTILNNGGQGWTSRTSWFARGIYGYKDKYLLTATLRRDGSSKFGPENRWAWFPSVSLAWRVSEEGFLSNSNTITDMKFRVGYGEVGNEGGSNGAFLSRLNSLTSYFGPAVRNAQYSNPAVKWESTSSYNVGVDFSLFGGRVDASVDAYLKDTDGLLLNVNLPAIFGSQVGGPTANVGNMENKGIEFSLRTVNVDKGKFYWSTNANLTINRNRVIDVGGAQFFGGLYWYSGFQTATLTQSGFPIGQFYGYVMDGIFTSRDEILNHAVQIPDDGDPNVNKIERTTGVWLGDIKWRDLNGDGVINTDDQTVIGDPNPDFEIGFNNTFRYGPFTLDIFITGAFGYEILNYSRARNEQLLAIFDNQSVTVQNRARTQLIDGGTDPNNIDHVELIDPTTNIPRFDNGGENFNHFMSTRWLEDGSYVRIQNLKLAFNVPAAWNQKLKLTNAQIYANIQNLATFTNYSGLDPQIGAFNQSPLVQNVDMGRYPAPRVYTIGVNVDF